MPNNSNTYAKVQWLITNQSQWSSLNILSPSVDLSSVIDNMKAASLYPSATPDAYIQPSLIKLMLSINPAAL